MRREDPGVISGLKRENSSPLNMNFDVEIINLKTVVDDNSMITADPGYLPRVQHKYNVIILC